MQGGDCSHWQSHCCGGSHERVQPFRFTWAQPFVRRLSALAQHDSTPNIRSVAADLRQVHGAESGGRQHRGQQRSEGRQLQGGRLTRCATRCWTCARGLPGDMRRQCIQLRKFNIGSPSEPDGCKGSQAVLASAWRGCGGGRADNRLAHEQWLVCRDCSGQDGFRHAPAPAPAAAGRRRRRRAAPAAAQRRPRRPPQPAAAPPSRRARRQQPHPAAHPQMLRCRLQTACSRHGTRIRHHARWTVKWAGAASSDVLSAVAWPVLCVIRLIGSLQLAGPPCRRDASASSLGARLRPRRPPPASPSSRQSCPAAHVAAALERRGSATTHLQA